MAIGPQYPLMIIKGNARGDQVLTKVFFGYGSRLVLGPLEADEQQKRFLGFDPLLSDSVTLCFQQGHPMPDV